MSLRSRITMCKDIGNRELACPKPRLAMVRIGSGDVDFKPVKKLTSCTSLPAEGDPGREILDILLEKACSVDAGHSPFLLGSPPTRASNPLIHDVQFTQKKVIPSPPTRASNPLIHDVHFTQKKVIPSPLQSPQKFSCRPGNNSLYKKSLCGASCGSTPYVRIEGFASSASSDAWGVPACA